MNGKLGIDPEATRKHGALIESQADDFKKLLDNIETTNDTLATQWTGTDATSYTTKINEQAQVMRQLQKTIYDMSTYLVQAANAYEKTIEENKVK